MEGVMVPKSLFRRKPLDNQKHLIWATWATNNFSFREATKIGGLLIIAKAILHIITSL